MRSLYPPEAIRQGLQGVLDQAALRAVRQVGSLSPTLAGRSILLPVRFRLL